MGGSSPIRGHSSLPQLRPRKLLEHVTGSVGHIDHCGHHWARSVYDRLTMLHLTRAEHLCSGTLLNIYGHID